MLYLVKIGGSLIPRYIIPLHKELEKISKSCSCGVILFPGGGEFADLIREYRKELSLAAETTHKMALASLDQNAYLMADLCKCAIVNTVSKLKSPISHPVIFAPYRFLAGRLPFAGYNLNIDIFSSDSSAFYIAYLLNAKLVIATDVDGVYKKDPRKNKKSRLLREISADALAKIKGGGPLDETLPGLIDKYKKEVWVVNGKFPGRIKHIIYNHKTTIGTLISPTNTPA